MENKLIILYGLITVIVLIIFIPFFGFIVGPIVIQDKENEKVVELEEEPVVKIDIGEVEIIEDKDENEEKIIGTLIAMQTIKGDIKIELFDDVTPITVQNFLSLIEKDFYDGIIFHRVIENFMIQGGCPLGTGFGGSDPIECEFISRIENNRGTLSMANAGLNTGSSQFFINLVDNNHLDGDHTVFGRVIDGMDVVDTIGAVEVVGVRPVSDITINDIIIKKQ